MNSLSLSILLITIMVSFSLGYSVVHSDEHQEINRMQDALESANQQVNGVYLAGEKRAVNAKNEAKFARDKLQQTHDNDRLTIKFLKEALARSLENNKPCKPTRNR